MEGFEAHQGSVNSKNFLEETELSGIGKLLALTPNAEVNSLAALYLSRILGAKNVYQLTVEEDEEEQGEAVSQELRGKILFGTNYTYYYLLKRFNQDSKIKSTPITEEYDYKIFLSENGSSQVVPMFLIDKDKNLVVYTSEYKPEPKPGHTLISLVQKDDPVEKRNEAELFERKE